MYPQASPPQSPEYGHSAASSQAIASSPRTSSFSQCVQYQYHSRSISTIVDSLPIILDELHVVVLDREAISDRLDEDLCLF